MVNPLPLTEPEVELNAVASVTSVAFPGFGYLWLLVYYLVSSLSKSVAWVLLARRTLIAASKSSRLSQPW